MRKISTAVISAAAVAALVGGGVYLAQPSSAAVPPSVPGNITVLGTAPRVVSSPGDVFEAGQQRTYTIAGKTFGGTVNIPANATGVTLSVTALRTTGTGGVKVWTTDAGEPGSPAVAFVQGAQSTNVVFVGLNDKGQLNVKATTKTNVLISIVGYVTPVAPIQPQPPVVKTIAAKEPTTLTGVGGSIRFKSTAMGSVTLPAGTWDARAIGGFTGLNNTNSDCTPEGTFLTGTMVLVKREQPPGEPWAFADAVATAGGVEIPESNSATLTQDPTLTISKVFTLTAETKISIEMFAYASNSSTACEGTVKANTQGAEFIKLA